MRKLITLLSGLFFLLLMNAGNVFAQQWAFNGSHIYNLNTANVGISNGALWAPTEKLHVNTLGAGIASVMAESNYVGTASRAIGYYRIKSTASGELFNLSLRKNGANHEMLQSCFIPGFGWAEYSYFNYTTRKYEMRVGIMDAEFLNSGKFLISSVGNTGIGVVNPLEKLDVNGAILLGNSLNNNPGSIRWDGFNFLGHNGTGWIPLDYQPGPLTWVIIPNPAPGFGNPQLYPATPPASISNALPGMPNFGGWIHAVDAPAPGLYPHQLMLESMTGPGALSASQLFRISSGFNPPNIDFSMGIFGGDGTFKLTNVPNLFPTIYSDNISMLRVFPSGIVDLPNQSRARAYQLDPGGLIQSILPGLWTPVNFTNSGPIPIGYDEQFEFVVAPAANAPAPPEFAFFVASTEGYYQVNARCEFDLTIAEVNPGSYVSIAIYSGPAPGLTVPYAIGNNLQIGAFGPIGEPFALQHNNAPNVSDVVYLLPGQIISIWVYHTAIGPLNLIQGSDKCYVSIHKVS